MFAEGPFWRLSGISRNAAPNERAMSFASNSYRNTNCTEQG